jgi:hypothetical protein
MGDIKFYSPVDFDDTSSGVTIEGDLTANKGVEFTGGSIGQAKTVLHTNNVLYTRGGSGGMFLQNADGSDGILISNDHIKVETGGLERLRINGSGNVGIGTTSPQTKLHLATTSSSTLTIQNTTNSGNATLNFRDEGDNDQFQIYYALGANRSYNLVNGNGLTIYSSQSSSEIARFGNASSGYTDSYFTGNVGIGTTSPAEELTVSGDSNITGKLAVGASAAHGTYHFYNQLTAYFNGAVTIDDTLTQTGGGNSTFSGNVGIGTTSPTHLLTLETTSSPGLKIKDTTQGATLLAFSQDSNSHIGTYSSHPLVLDTNSSERMRITSAGNVGIGTTAPTRLLTLENDTGTVTNNSQLRINNQGDGDAYIYLYAGSDWSLGVDNSDGDKFKIVSSNDVSDEAGALEIDRSNNATFAGDVKADTHFTSSDTNVTLSTNSDGTVFLRPNGKGSTTAQSTFTTSLASIGTNATFAGNVGIGYNAPYDILHLHNSTNSGTPDAQMNFTTGVTGAADGNGFRVGWNGSVANLFLFENADMRFATNNNEKMRITSGGNVGIGTTSPSEKLHVAGDVKIEGDLHLEGDLDFRVINSSGFGQPEIRLPNFVDTFWRADRRFTLSVTGGQSAAAVANLFNGSYGNLVNFAASSTHVITINVANQSGVSANGFTYPQGYIYFSFYSTTNNYDSISGRVKDKDGNYHNMSGLTDIISNNTSYKVMRLTVPSNNYAVEYELTLVTNTNNVRLAAINYVSTRHTSQMELPYLSKTLDTNSLFGNVDVLTNASADQNRLSGTGNSYLAASTGNVGVGTTSPGAKLDVVASDVSVVPNGSSSAVFRRNGDNYISILSSTSGEGGVLFGNSSDAVDGWVAYKNGSGNQYMTIGTADTERMRITSGGNVGIGTTNPSQKLHINGGAMYITDGTYGGYIGKGSDLITTAAASDLGVRSEANMVFSTGGYVEKMRITSAGKVGIGTTSPDTKLHVEQGLATLNTTNLDNGTAVGLHLTYPDTSLTGGEGIALAMGMNGRGRSYIANLSASTNKDASDMLFYTENGNVIGERMRIDSSGNVGIGTASPGHLLEINGTGDALSVGNDTNTLTYMRFANERTMIGYSGANAVVQGGLTKGIRFNVNNNTFNSGNAMAIDTSGNVGIGTTSPDNVFHIVKDQGGVASALKLENKAGANNSGFDIDFQLASSGLSAKIGAIRTNNPGAGDTDLFFSTSTDGANLAERMRITHNGNVGIGTTSPGAKLEVRSDGSAAGGAEIRLQHANNNTTDVVSTLNFANNAGSVAMIQGGTTGANNTGYISFFTDNAGASSEKMRILGGGNVGIGTTSPGAKLDIKGDGADIFLQSNDFKIARIQPRGTGANLDKGLFSLFDGSTEDVRIDTEGSSWLNGGNVGIGTTSPSQKLTVVGNTYISSGLLLLDNNQDIRWGDAGERITGNNTNGLVFTTNNLETMRINSSGDVGIGTTSPGYKLEIAEDTDGTADLLMLRNSDSTYAQTWGFQSDTNKDLVITGSSGVGGFKFVPGSRGATFAGDVYIPSKLEHTGDSDTFLNFSDDTITLSAGGSSTTFSGNGNSAFAGDVTLADNKKLTFGAAPDFEIYHNSTTNVNHISSLLSRQLSISSDTTIFSGNVGIGTTSPSVPLDILGQDGTTDVSSITYNNLFRFRGTDSGGLFFLGKTSDQDQVIQTTNNDADLIFGTRTASVNYDRLHIQGNTGNVGIGTTSPAAKLHVAGSSGAIGGTGVTYLNNADDAFSLVINNAGTSAQNDRGVFDARVGGSSVFRINNSSNVGIGTTSPVQKLHINNSTASSASYAKFSNAQTGTTTADGFDVGVNTGDDAIIWQRENSNLLFATSNSEKMRITSGGNVGIGTSSPTSYDGDADDLVVATSGNTGISLRSSTVGTGSIFFADGTTGAERYQGVLKYNHSNNSMAFSTSATERMRIDSSGNVGILTTSMLNTATNRGSLTIGGSAAGTINIGNGSINFGIYATTAESSIYSLGVMKFSVGSGLPERMRITSAGNVGIGTTSPAYKLDVTGNSTSGVVAVRNSANGRDTFRSENAAGTRTLNIGNDGSGHGVVLVRNSSGTTTNYIAGSGNSYFNAGNVGIGTTSPGARLHVKDSIRIDTVSAPNQAPQPQTQSPTQAIIKNASSNPSYDFYLSEPDEWLLVNINGTDYVLPAYEA